MTRHSNPRTTARRAALALAAALACLALPGAATAQEGPAGADAALDQYYALRATDPAAAHARLREAAATLAPDARVALELGYYLLEARQPAEALPWFEQAAGLDPARADVWKQIGYVRKALDRPAEALAAFDRAHDLAPDDSAVGLERAYLSQKLGRNHAAAAIFRDVALAAADPAVARRACDAHATLRGLPDKVLPEPWFAETYAAPGYDSHWDMAVLPVQARLGRVLSDAGQVEGYVGLRLNADTRSGRGLFGPEIYTDNVAVAFAGLRARPVKSVPLTLFVEAGPARDLTDRARDRWRGDLRGGFLFFQEWGATAPCHGRQGIRPIADLYTDGVAYSRYDGNVLFYVRARPGLRLADSGKLALDAYLLGAAGFDTRDRAGNRFQELGLGAALHLYEPGTLAIRAEGVRVFRQQGLSSYSTLRLRLEHFARF